MTEPRRCILCERLFSQSEIDQGIPIQHARRNRILMTRFPSGDLHQFKLAKKQKPQTIPKGAFFVKPVVPPPVTVEAPPEEITEVAATPDTPTIEDLAQTLTDHFEHSQDAEPYNAEPAEAESGKHFHDEHAVEKLGQYVDGIVVMYSPTHAKGYIRILEFGRQKSGLFFRSDDIISGEFIGIGVKVRCLVSEPMSGREALTARQIEILELEPESKTSNRTKIYQHDQED